MQIGNKIAWGAIPSLDLPAFERDLPESGFYREVKVYKVPPEVHETGYFLSVQEGSDPEEPPACLIRDTELLLHFTQGSFGQPQILYAHPAVQAA